jgi:hypothetical protein
MASLADELSSTIDDFGGGQTVGQSLADEFGLDISDNEEYHVDDSLGTHVFFEGGSLIPYR